MISGHEDGAEAGHDSGESLKPENDGIHQDESGDGVCKKLRLDQRQGMFTEPQQVCAPWRRIEILQGITRRAEFRANAQSGRREELAGRHTRVRADHCRTCLKRPGLRRLCTAVRAAMALSTNTYYEEITFRRGQNSN